MSRPTPAPAPAPVLDAYDPDAFEALAGRIVAQVSAHMRSALAGETRVLESIEPDALLQATEPIDGAAGGDAVLETLLASVIQHANHVHHPGYIGHQVSVPLPAATLAEVVSLSLSNGMAVYEMGQMHTAMERRVTQWLGAKLGWGDESDGVLTHGGSLGNLTALLAARQAVAGYDVWTEGQRQPMAVLVSDQAHYCVARAVQCMGWGAGGAALVPTDERFRLRPEALAETLRRCRDEGRQVIAVAASSCSTATGSFDPLPEIADFCAEEGLWLHVDGAHGASLVLSDRHRAPVEGIERADSVTWDLHKLMGLPGLNTAVLFREGRRSYEAFAQNASYLFDDAERDEWFQIGRRTMECTKRGMSVVAYTMLKSLGERFFRDHVDRLIDTARLFADALGAAEDFELATYPEANILCFRHLPDRGGGGGGAGSDAHQASLRAALQQEGNFYITQAKLNGSLWLRLSVQNPFTGPREVEGLMEALRRL